MASLKSWHQTQACVSRVLWNHRPASQGSGCAVPNHQRPPCPTPARSTRAPAHSPVPLLLGLMSLGQRLQSYLSKQEPWAGLGWTVLGEGQSWEVRFLCCSPNHPGGLPALTAHSFWGSELPSLLEGAWLFSIGPITMTPARDGPGPVGRWPPAALPEEEQGADLGLLPRDGHWD